MKNIIKKFWIITIVVIIISSIVACEDEIDKLKKDDSSTNGRLTITGLNSYIGHTINFNSITKLDNGDRFSITRTNSTKPLTFGSTVNDDSCTMYVWISYESKGAGGYKNYTGNDKNVEFEFIVNSVWGSVTVDFTNGIGTGAFVPY